MTVCCDLEVDSALQNSTKWWTSRYILAMLFAWYCWVSSRNCSSIHFAAGKPNRPYKVLIKSTC